MDPAIGFVLAMSAGVALISIPAGLPRLPRIDEILGNHRPDPMYFSGASAARVVAPGELPGPVPVTSSQDDTVAIGSAAETGRVGGWVGPLYFGKPEATWTLAIGGATVPGRFVLRTGVFVELAEGPD
jgi:hypothetical protein